MNHTDRDLLLAGRAEAIKSGAAPGAGLLSPEERGARRRELRDLRTFREKLVDGVRRAWYGPPPEPLTDEEVTMIMRPRDAEEDDLPERVPPDDPERLAWEAELRAMGVRPARKWNFPMREPIRRPGVWERIKYRISRGW